MFPLNLLRVSKKRYAKSPTYVRWLCVVAASIAISIPVAQDALAQAAATCTAVKQVHAGSKSNVSTLTISEMTAITAVKLLGVDSGATCSAGDSYWYSGNILNTKKKCVGDFEVTGTTTSCDGYVSQEPLFLTQRAEPNVMFILDDSGSMRFEMVPEQLISETGADVRFVFPRASNVYDTSGEYSNYVPTVEDNDVYNARTRSPQINQIYYNPSVTYFPWITADGSRYPDADPQCALHNPERSGTGEAYCRDLTAVNSNYNSNRWYRADGTSTTDGLNFWPATYFWLNDSAAPTVWGSFEKVEIRPSQATYSGHGRENRDDCADSANGNCTHDEELQNFANWYTYYRSRILSARAGVGLAFAQQGSGLLVGFGAINKGSTSIDGVNTNVIMRGVRSFEGEARKEFFDLLYTHPIPAEGTPLRRALDAAGQYYSRSDDVGPWGLTPGTDTNEQVPCRRCYTVLMTDGYWSGGSGYRAATAAAQADNDGTDGTTISSDRADGGSYTYNPASPFSDTRSNTLADVAMYYWKNDLRAGSGGLPNIVAPVTKSSPTNPAFWQHMTTFGVGLGVYGTINPDDAFAAIGSGATITWPNPNEPDANCSGTECDARVDDLLHAAVNSRGGFFSASDPTEFAEQLSSQLRSIMGETRSSSSSIAANSTRLDEGTVIYQASFSGGDWTGQIRAFKPDPDDGQINANDPEWDTNNAGTFASSATRKIFTPAGLTGTTIDAGIDFTWTALSADQKALLQPGDSLGDSRLNWLRGDSSNEGTSFRSRTFVGEDNVSRHILLGDVVNSDPLFVGSTEDFGFRVLPGDEGAAYATFLSTDVGAGGKKGRKNMLYIGANDGMLHGFDAAEGEEVFAYIPAGVFANLHELTSRDYEHRYFVDGSPRASDVYFSSDAQWHTVLVGATGAGGKSVFALDITNPDEVNKDSLLWEFSTNVSSTHKMGLAMSQPVVARVKAGDRWVAIFGGGYEIDSGNQGLFVVDLQTGSLVAFIETSELNVNNGLASPIPVDINNDRITDYVYAGDLNGNLWRFDFTSNSSSGWSAFKLFTAVDGDGVAQPITSRPAVGRHPDGGVMVYFGTGKYFQNGDAKVSSDPQVQSFYAVRDQLGNSEILRSSLTEQEIIFEGAPVMSGGATASFEVRAVSDNAVGVYGWYIDLIPPSPADPEGERVVSTPIVRFGRVIFTTIIPSEDPCLPGGTSWLMEVDAITGGRLEYSALDINNDGNIDDNDYIEVNGEFIPASGIGSPEMIKTPGIVGAGEVEYKYTSGSSGSIGVTREKSGGAAVGRQSWRQLQ